MSTLITIEPNLSLSFFETTWFSKSIKEKTNCFTYVLGEPKAGQTYPGHLKDSFYAFAKVPVYHLKQQLLDEGFIEIAEQDAYTKPIHAIVALRDNPRIGDFHFLRFNKADGFWSFKQGGLSPSNKDASGKIITHIEEANLGNYDDLVGYFRLPKEGIISQQRLYL